MVLNYSHELLQVTRRNGVDDSTHVMWIQPCYFWAIQAQRKIVEPRLASPAMERIFPGDIIRFVCDNGYQWQCSSQPGVTNPASVQRFKWNPQNSIDVKVLSMVKYSSFKELLEYEGVTNCLPDISDIPTGIATYNGFPNYVQLAPKIGVIAFRITINLHDATPLPRPLLVVRGGKRTHVLTRHEIQILTGAAGELREGHEHKKTYPNAAKSVPKLEGTPTTETTHANHDRC